MSFRITTVTFRRHRRARRFAMAAIGVGLFMVSVAQAGERRFTYIYEALTLPKGSVEYEQWVTWKTHKSSDKDFNRFDFRHEFEFGITDSLQLSLYVADWRYQSGSSVQDGAEFRDVAVEVIYNVLDPTTEPLGLSLYGETRIGPELLELEGKLILQANLGKWVFAWNGTIEAEWEGSNFSEDKGVFQQTIGGSYQFTPTLLAGFELLHEVEYEDWSRFGDHAVYGGPNLSYRARGWWITVTPLVQFTDVDSEPDFQLRLIFGIDF